MASAFKGVSFAFASTTILMAGGIARAGVWAGVWAAADHAGRTFSRVTRFAARHESLSHFLRTRASGRLFVCLVWYDLRPASTLRRLSTPLSTWTTLAGVGACLRGQHACHLPGGSGRRSHSVATSHASRDAGAPRRGTAVRNGAARRAHGHASHRSSQCLHACERRWCRTRARGSWLPSGAVLAPSVET